MDASSDGFRCLRARGGFLLTLGLAAATGCGVATSGMADAAPGTDAVGVDAGRPVAVDLGTANCAPTMKYGGGETPMMEGTVTAKIVDESGAPVAGQPVYICGIDLYSAPKVTGVDGTVSLHTALSMKKPAFKFGDALNYAELAIPLTAATTDFTTGNQLLATGKLADKPGAALTPGSDATSGDVTLSIPAGAAVGIDPLVYDTPEKQKLRTVNIPLTNLGQVLAPVMVGGAPPHFALVYGLSPAETPVCPPAKVKVALPHRTTVPNDLGWAPGTAVEFWIMTIDPGQLYAPYAGWAKASDGVVNGDGTSVITTTGFNFLENFAIRKAQ